MNRKSINIFESILILFCAAIILVLSLKEKEISDLSLQISILQKQNIYIEEKNQKIFDDYKAEQEQIKIALEEENTALQNEIIKLQKELEEQINDKKEISDAQFGEQTEQISPTESNEKWNIGKEVPLPSCPSDIFYCTDYRFYNLPGTPHYRLQQVAWTDYQGARRFNDDYIVGLGSGYATRIGERFKITLENGKVFTVIMGDGKGDDETDSTHRFAPYCDSKGNLHANILEFIIDDEIISSKAYSAGGMHYYEDFKGSIVSMVYLGRDDTYDWDTYF